MEKSRVLIVCSSSTIILAQQLRDDLMTPYCEAALWSEEGGIRTAETVVEALEEQFDFAVFLLAQNDVKVTRGGGSTAARDAFIFDTGLGVAAIGRKRCFLVTSVRPGDLPAPLAGVTTLPFEAPTDLADPDACAAAIGSAAVALKESIQRDGRYLYHVPVPTLSYKELWQRELPHSKGGDLFEGHMLVCDTQPISDEALAARVRHNMDNGISYSFFFHFSADSVAKICQSLQVILVAGVIDPEQALDFNTRMSQIRENKTRILDDFDRILQSRQLQIALMPSEPQFSFRIHNASNLEQATLYVRYGDHCFVPWAHGLLAESLWRRAPSYLEADGGAEHLFVRLMPPYGLDSDRQKEFERCLDLGISRYFPGIEGDIRHRCTGAPA